jgi:hypothetical protein
MGSFIGNFGFFGNLFSARACLQKWVRVAEFAHRGLFFLHVLVSCNGFAFRVRAQFFFLARACLEKRVRVQSSRFGTVTRRLNHCILYETLDITEFL